MPRLPRYAWLLHAVLLGTVAMAIVVEWGQAIVIGSLLGGRGHDGLATTFSFATLAFLAMFVGYALVPTLLVWWLGRSIGRVWMIHLGWGALLAGYFAISSHVARTHRADQDQQRRNRTTETLRSIRVDGWTLDERTGLGLLHLDATLGERVTVTLEHVQMTGPTGATYSHTIEAARAQPRSGAVGDRVAWDVSLGLPWSHTGGIGRQLVFRCQTGRITFGESGPPVVDLTADAPP